MAVRQSNREMRLKQQEQGKAAEDGRTGYLQLPLASIAEREDTLPMQAELGVVHLVVPGQQHFADDPS